LLLVATSAVQALNAASFAVEPKKVISESAITTIITARLAVLINETIGKSTVDNPHST
jgi:hypothetical protein